MVVITNFVIKTTSIKNIAENFNKTLYKHQNLDMQDFSEKQKRN